MPLIQEANLSCTYKIKNIIFYIAVSGMCRVVEFLKFVVSVCLCHAVPVPVSCVGAS